MIDFRKSRFDDMNARSLLKLAVLVASCFVCLSLRLILGTLKKLNCRRHLSGNDKLLILGFGGVGNHLMLTPAVREIKRARPELSYTEDWREALMAWREWRKRRAAR